MRLALAPLVTPAHVRAVAARFDSSSAKAASEDVRIRLSHQGLLVASSKGEGVWRIPQAVREALVSEYLSGSPGEALLWHRVFAKELQETRDSAYLGLIVGHARAAEDWCYLLELWEENSLVLIDAYPADFVAAYGRMPSSVLMEHRGLAGAAAAADAIVEHPQGVATQRALLQVFREAIRPATGDDPVEGELELKPEPEPEADGAGNRRLLLLAVGVIADRVDGRVAQALAGAARLYRELTERPRAGETQPVRRAWVVHQWAQTLLLAGDEGRALEFELRAFSLAQGADTRTVAAHVASNIALIHAMEGNVDAARNWIGMRRERDTTGQWNDYIVRLPADIAEALLALDRLDRPEVERAIARMQDPTGQPEFWPFVIHVMTQHALLWADPMVALSAIDRYTVLNPQVVGSDGIATRLITRGRADLLLALGEVNKVKRLIDDAGSETPWLQTVRARLHLVCGNHQRALHIASAGAWDSGTATRDRIDQLMIVAAASYARGNEAAAVQSFAMASSLADELGAIRPFALIAPAVREALLLSSGVDADHTRLDTVRGVGAVFPRDADLVTLSERELAVLYEMTRSQRLTEIARELVVSSSTVKKQMVSLYSKLGVHDRDAAMLRATRLGLLPVPMKSATDQV